MGLLDFLLKKKSENIKDFQNKGAVIIDVRTEAEYKQGAIAGSKNIPLQIIGSKLGAIKKLNKPIITCCASGIRSGKAANILKGYGIECTNGGGWNSLKNKLSL